MNNKICGECLYLYMPDWTECLLDGSHIVWAKPACERFKQKLRDTYGDQIRAMSDEELAEKFVYQVNYDYCYSEFYSTLIPDKEFDSKQEAIAATIVELEKEVKNE